MRPAPGSSLGRACSFAGDRSSPSSSTRGALARGADCGHPEDMDLAPGQLINERYRVERVLGAGGMGQVLAAVDLQSGGRPVAIKLLPAEVADDSSLLTRFRREAELAARVDAGGGVARVFDFSRHAGRPFCVLELCSGGDLDEAFRAGAVERERLLEVVEALARTLGRCHAAGVVHRDVKPQNVLLDEQGRPKLCDFGLALDLGVEERMTLSQDVMGTPAYMAPEQADAIKSAGPPADVYALGVILYRGVCGRPPFEGSPAQVLTALLSKSPPAPSELAPEVSADLEALILRAMAADPSARPSADELAQLLARLRAGESLGFGPTRRSRRRGALALAGVALVLGAAGAAAALARARLEQAARWERVAALPPGAFAGLAPLESELAADLPLAAEAPAEELAGRVRQLRRWDAFQRQGTLDLSEARDASSLSLLVEGAALSQRAAATSAPREALADCEEALRRLSGCRRAFPEAAAALSARVERTRYLRWLAGALRDPGSREQVAARLRLSRLEPGSQPAGWVAAKRELLVAEPLDWPEPSLLGARPELSQALVSVLEAAPACAAPPPLLEAFQREVARWARWALAAPAERVASLAIFANVGPSLSPSYRDPPATRRVVAAVLEGLAGRQEGEGRLSSPAFYLYLRVHPGMQVFRTKGTKTPKWEGLAYLAPRPSESELPELRERLPGSRALALWAALAAPLERLDERLARQACEGPLPDLHSDLRGWVYLWRSYRAVPLGELRAAPPRERKRIVAQLARQPRRAEALALLEAGRAAVREDLRLFSLICEDELALLQLEPAAFVEHVRARLSAARAALAALEPAVRSFEVDSVLRLAVTFAAQGNVYGVRYADAMLQVLDLLLELPEQLGRRFTNPQLLEVFLQQVRALRGAGHAEEALAAADACPKRVYEAGNAHFLAGERLLVLLDLGRLEEARRSLREARRRWPDADGLAAPGVAVERALAR